MVRILTKQWTNNDGKYPPFKDLWLCNGSDVSQSMQVNQYQSGLMCNIGSMRTGDSQFPYDLFYYLHSDLASAKRPTIDGSRTQLRRPKGRQSEEEVDDDDEEDDDVMVIDQEDDETEVEEVGSLAFHYKAADVVPSSADGYSDTLSDNCVATTSTVTSSHDVRSETNVEEKTVQTPVTAVIEQTDFMKGIDLIRTRDLRRQPTNYVKASWSRNEVSRSYFHPSKPDIGANARKLQGLDRCTNANGKVEKNGYAATKKPVNLMKSPTKVRGAKTKSLSDSIARQINHMFGVTDWKEFLNQSGVSSPAGRLVVENLFQVYKISSAGKRYSLLSSEMMCSNRHVRVERTPSTIRGVDCPTIVTRSRSSNPDWCAMRCVPDDESHWYSFGAKDRWIRSRGMQRRPTTSGGGRSKQQTDDRDRKMGRAARSRD